MMKTAKKQSGFTMIELIISLVITAMVVGGILTYSSKLYQQYTVTASMSSMKADAANIRVLMQSDVNEGGKVALLPDNKGVTIKSKNETNLYFVRDGAIYRRQNDKTESKLTEYKVTEALWTMDKGILTLNMTFLFNNAFTKQADYQKIIKDVYVTK
jgi:prepilin-type N-terminal cleavage/methylation domain-containing protein